MDWLDLILRRETVITLAVGGALAATLGSYRRQRRAGARDRLGDGLFYGGYALTGVSVLIFIVMGFRGG
jgi:hypothetical protein